MYKIKRFGYCDNTKEGCIRKDEKTGKYIIISNRTGKPWNARYKSKEKAENALKAYHANK